MKTRHIFYLSLLFAFFYSEFLLCTDFTRELTGYKAFRFKKTIHSDNSSQIDSDFDNDYGAQIPQSGDKLINRATWEFYLPTNLSVGAYVKKIELIYKTNTNTYFVSGYVSDFSYNWTVEQRWNVVDIATNLATLPGSTGGTTVIVSQWVEPIRNATFQQRPKIYISFRCQNELVNTTPTGLESLSLKITYQTRFNYYVKNNFDAGLIKVNGATVNSGLLWPLLEGPNTFEAIEPQQNAGYQYIWNDVEAPINKSDWKLRSLGGVENPIGESIILNHNATSTENNFTIIANLKKQLNLGFQNNFIGVGNGETIIVNGTQYNSPATGFTVVEQNPISATAQDQTINGIDYAFSGWYDGPSSNANLISSERTHNFYPGGHITYYAHFVGTANISQMHVQNNSGTVGAYPTLTWTDNINSNVSYKIYRQEKIGNDWGTRNLINTVSPGTQMFADRGLYQTGSNKNFALSIDAFYNTESTAATAGSALFSANWYINPNKRNFVNNQSAEITEYKLYDNFPNPFNPSTEIYYQLPSDGNVKLKVYNMMGQEVMTLVNEFKEKGMYNVSFNAGSLASGMYIYKLEAGNFIQVKKMLLTK